MPTPNLPPGFDFTDPDMYAERLPIDARTMSGQEMTDVVREEDIRTWLATIEARAVVEKILTHLGLPADPPCPSPARTPEWLPGVRGAADHDAGDACGDQRRTRRLRRRGRGSREMRREPGRPRRQRRLRSPLTLQRKE